MINTTTILIVLLCIIVISIITGRYISVRRDEDLSNKTKLISNTVCYMIILMCIFIGISVFNGDKRVITDLVQPCDVVGIKEEDEYVTVLTLNGNYQFEKDQSIIDVNHIDDVDGEGILVEESQVHVMLLGWIKDDLKKEKVTIYIDDNK